MGDGVRVQLRLSVVDNVGLTLVRDVVLPAVPRVGELVYVGPHWDPAPVEQVTWRVDDPDEPDDVDEPVVRLLLEDIDLQVAADDPNVAVAAFREVGWRTD